MACTLSASLSTVGLTADELLITAVERPGVLEHPGLSRSLSGFLPGMDSNNLIVQVQPLNLFDHLNGARVGITATFATSLISSCQC
jgi:hypothetical protein